MTNNYLYHYEVYAFFFLTFQFSWDFMSIILIFWYFLLFIYLIRAYTSFHVEAYTSFHLKAYASPHLGKTPQDYL